jgi:small redox-active disulfide protein 2
MKVQIAGPGCPNCQNTERNVVNACAGLDFAADISHVTNIADILDLGVMRTPAVLIDGDVVISGRVPTVSELNKILETRRVVGPRTSELLRGA